MAILHNKLNINPTNRVTLPKVNKKEPIFLTVSQLKGLALASGKYQDLIIFLGLTGLRFVEMAALKVKNWNSKTNKLAISENITEISYRNKWSTFLGNTKEWQK